MIKLFSKISALFLVTFGNMMWLFVAPYKAVRKISKISDTAQLFMIYALVYVYFIFASIVRKKTLAPFIITSSSLLSFSFFLITLFATITFFYLSARVFRQKNISYRSLLFTFTYSLTPTIIWFLITSVLYLLIPPPRTSSFLGVSFSIFFILFSTTMLSFRIILFYLSLRFSLKIGLYKIVFFSILFFIWFIPYSIMLYSIGIFRIPFI